MFWVNGEQQQTIALGDRSFQYGDGCFTTMLVVAGQIQYWRYHQQRLEKPPQCAGYSASRLGKC